MKETIQSRGRGREARSPKALPSQNPDMPVAKRANDLLGCTASEEKEETYGEDTYLAWFAPGPRASIPVLTTASDQRSQK